MKTRKTNGTSANASRLSREDTQSLKLAIKLMSISGGSGKEKKVADFIRDSLRKAGADDTMIKSDTAASRALLRGDTGNLIFKLPGNRRGPRRMLTAHMDTVPICVGAKPIIKGDKVVSGRDGYGIGADDRAGVAVTLRTALQILKHDLPHPPLTFCWFIQEEIGLHGARCVTKSMLGGPKLAFNWDGGSPTKLTVGATGGYRMQIQVRGVASHAGNAPEQGVSAIAIASLAIADLEQNGWHGAINKNGKIGTSNVGVFNGGSATNVVADQVEIKAEARSHDRTVRKRIVNEIEKAFKRAAKRVTNNSRQSGTVEFEGRLDYDSFKLEPGEPAVSEAQRAVTSLGFEPKLAIANGGVDANWLTKHGIPTVTLGCGQMSPHMATEALDINEFLTACQIALALATVPKEN